MKYENELLKSLEKRRWNWPVTLFWLALMAAILFFWISIISVMVGCSTKQHVLMGGKEYDCAVHSNGASSDLDCNGRQFKSVSNFTMVKEE